jgi:hypothetical protein
MPWIKKGPIFTPDGTNKLMCSHASIPFADKINERELRIYFSSRNLEGKSLPFSMVVNTKNLAEIISVNDNPVLLLGELGTFDDSGIMPSCIVDNSGNKYMYYIAWNPQVTVSYRLSIGLAISNDNGKSFKKYSIGPVCDRSLKEPFFNTAPFVMIENGIWRMWYVSCTGWEYINNYPEPKYHVKYCESPDGIMWLKKGIVCIDYDTASEAIGRPSVLKEDGIYKMYYSFRKIKNYRSDRNNSYRIGYAESNDGIIWNKLNNKAGISRSENSGDWDYEMMEYCHVFNNGGKKIMIYNGNGFGKTGFGYAEYEEQ